MRKRQEEKKKMLAAWKLERMKSERNLTGEQTKKIKGLNEKYREQLKKYRESSEPGRTEIMEQFLALRKQRQDD